MRRSPSPFLLALLPMLALSLHCGQGDQNGPDGGNVRDNGDHRDDGDGGDIRDGGDNDDGGDTSDGGDNLDGGDDGTIGGLRRDRAYLRSFVNTFDGIRLDGSFPNQGWEAGTDLKGGDVEGYVELEPGTVALTLDNPLWPLSVTTPALEGGKAYFADVHVVWRMGNPDDMFVNVVEEPRTTPEGKARFAVLGRREPRRSASHPPPTFAYELLDGLWGDTSMTNGTVEFGSSTTIDVEAGGPRAVRVDQVATIAGPPPVENRSTARAALPAVAEGDTGSIVLTATGIAVLGRGKDPVRSEGPPFLRVLNVDPDSPPGGYDVVSIHLTGGAPEVFPISPGLVRRAITPPMAVSASSPGSISVAVAGSQNEVASNTWTPLANTVVHAAIIRDPRLNMPDTVGVLQLPTLGHHDEPNSRITFTNLCSDGASVSLMEENGQFYQSLSDTEFAPLVHTTILSPDPLPTVEVRFVIGAGVYRFSWEVPSGPARWVGVLVCDTGSTAQLFLIEEITGSLQVLTTEAVPYTGP